MHTINYSTILQLDLFRHSLCLNPMTVRIQIWGTRDGCVSFIATLSSTSLLLPLCHPLAQDFSYNQKLWKHFLNISKNLLLTPLSLREVDGYRKWGGKQASPTFASSLIPSESSDQTKTSVPARDNLCWDNILIMSNLVIKAYLSTIWVYILAYSGTMNIKKEMNCLTLDGHGTPFRPDKNC